MKKFTFSINTMGVQNIGVCVYVCGGELPGNSNLSKILEFQYSKFSTCTFQGVNNKDTDNTTQ